MTCESVEQWMIEKRAFLVDPDESMPVAVADHLQTCAACQRQAQWEAAIHRSMHQVEVPGQLELDIQYQLRRARRERQRARTLYVSLAAAAALLLTVCLSWYIQRPYDLTKLSAAIVSMEMESRRTIASQAFAQPVNAQQLKLWLERQGVGATIPKRLKLQCVTAAHIVDIGGRKVPVLELQVGGSAGKVCLLERRFFDEKSLRQLHDNENLSSFILADSDDSQSLGWMIVYQGSAQLFVEGTLNPNGA